jgi:cell division protein FtsL
MKRSEKHEKWLLVTMMIVALIMTLALISKLFR